jgi:hypothetical protein
MCRKHLRTSSFEHDDGMLTLFVCSTTFHLASLQETLHASLLPLTDTDNLGYSLPGNVYPPINIYTYPFVSASPPFPFLAKPPASFAISGDKTSMNDIDAHLRSAVGLSHTRTMELFKRFGPILDVPSIHTGKLH